jgi:UDP-N-acetylmuramyl pentapeptide phosphotransferase/UDP-N-acetylglucosamine-1-phosphate transferase
VAPHPIRAGVVAHVVTRASRALLERAVGDGAAPVHAPAPGARVPGAPGRQDPAAGVPLTSAERWTRTNHRGEPVSLLEAPSTAAGLLVAGLVGGGSPRAAVAATLATAGGAAFGLLDDLTEDTTVRTKGLRGHLGALAHGRVTTGGLKVLGIGATSLVAALVATPRSGPGAAVTTRGRAADVLASGALVAGTANLVNLLDLRAGRALKAAALCAGPVALAGGRGAGAAAAVVGAAAGALPRDLAERDMLGDGGANAVGALLGTAIVLDAPRPVRLAFLAVVVALTLASERVSFTQVIASRPVLRELDEWGRRPAEEGTAAHAVAFPDAVA